MNTTDTLRRQWSLDIDEQTRMRGPFVIQRRDHGRYIIWYEATQAHSTANVEDVDTLSVPIPAIGTRFAETDSRRWTDANGEKHTHTTTLECEVTYVTTSGTIQYEIVAVLDESDRPEGGFTPDRGEISWFGWEAAILRGRVAVR